MSRAEKIVTDLLTQVLNAQLEQLERVEAQKSGGDVSGVAAWRETSLDLARLAARSIIDLAHREGAAVAFGLIGMAEAINEREFWRRLDAETVAVVDELIEADSTAEHLAAQGVHGRPVVGAEALIGMHGGAEALIGMQCEHPEMESDGVHYNCPACGLHWDDWGESGTTANEEWHAYIADIDDAIEIAEAVAQEDK